MSARTILNLLLWHQRKLEGATIAAQPPLEALESYIVTLIQSGTCRFSSTLVSTLGLDKTRVSRIISDLEERGLVSSSPTPEDRRQHELSVTAQGLQRLQQNNELLSSVIRSLMQPLTPSELSELEKQFRKLADSFSCPPAIQSPQLHPLFPELRRLSHAFGIISSQFAATDLNSAEFQVLYMLATSGSPMRSVEISRFSGFPRSTTSRIIQSLSDKKLLSSETDPNDARNHLLLATTRGARLIQEAGERAARLLNAALAPLGKSFCERFELLMRKYCESSAPPYLAEFRYEELKTPEDRREACLFVVNELLRQDKANEIDTHIFFDDSRVITARHEDAIVGVSEFIKQGRGWSLRRLVVATDLLKRDSQATPQILAGAKQLCS